MNNNILRQKDYFPALDGFRALSCIGIMMMHIQANTHYMLSGFVWERLIPSFTHLILLFLMISGFGMCAGYLEKFWNGAIDLEKFYKRRYAKILPYFGFLIVIALLYEPSLANFYDATMETLLIYGFLPNNALNVIGVGWTLGVIFVFYFLFPAFSVLLKTKRRAWIFLALSLWVHFVCTNYYFSAVFVTPLFTARHSFIWCLPLFTGGGIMYLYKTEIRRLCNKMHFLCLFVCLIFSVLYYLTPNSVGSFDILFYKNFILYSAWLAYAVGTDSRFFGNKTMSFLSGISLEIYLSHMFVFRFFEKLHVQYLFGNDTWISYILLCAFTLAGLFALIFGYKLAMRFLKDLVIQKIFVRGKSNEQ